MYIYRNNNYFTVDTDTNKSYVNNFFQSATINGKFHNAVNGPNFASFGNKYKNFETVKKSFECSFNALHVRSNKHGMDLSKRGIHDEIQKRVQQGKGFCDFIISVIENIEKHNYKNIGIFCSAGHHRSVACVELLKKFVYKNATVIHLNL